MSDLIKSRALAGHAYNPAYLANINRVGFSLEVMPTEAPCFLDTINKTARLVKKPIFFCKGDYPEGLPHIVVNSGPANEGDNCWCGRNLVCEVSAEYGRLAAAHYREIDAYLAEERRVEQEGEFPSCYVCCINEEIMNEPVNVCNENFMHNMDRSALDLAERNQHHWYRRGQCPGGGAHCTGHRPREAAVNPVLKHMLDRWEAAKKGFIEAKRSQELVDYENSPRVSRRDTPPASVGALEEPLPQSVPPPQAESPPPRSWRWMISLFAFGISFAALFGYGVYRSILLGRDLYLRFANFRLTR